MSFDLEGKAWTNPDTEHMWDFEEISFAIRWKGTGTLSSPECKLYLNGEDVTSTYMLSGSDSVSGRVQSSKVVSAVLGGETYELRWKVTDTTIVRGTQTELIVLEAGQERG